MARSAWRLEGRVSTKSARAAQLGVEHVEHRGADVLRGRADARVVGRDEIAASEAALHDAHRLISAASDNDAACRSDDQGSDGGSTSATSDGPRGVYLRQRAPSPESACTATSGNDSVPPSIRILAMDAVSSISGARADTTAPLPRARRRPRGTTFGIASLYPWLT